MKRRDIFSYQLIIPFVYACGLSMCSFMLNETKAQSVGIGTTTPHNSAQVEISSNGKGLLIPRMTTVMLNSINNPAKGLMVYDSTSNRLMVNMGSSTAPNWQTIVANSGWSLSGNSGTIPAAQFIGTTDNNPLMFRINYQFAGKIDSAFGHTFFGYGAGKNTVLSRNTAVGYRSMNSNTMGIQNSALGYQALFSSTTASYNTAMGGEALYSNTDGYANTAVGSHALYLNTEGNSNSAIGVSSMYSNTTGIKNTANGSYALYYNTTGSRNTALGDNSLFSNNIGEGNTAVGRDAGRNSTTAFFNTSVGFGAGGSWNMGYNNTMLGADCDMNNHGLFNTIAIGQGVTVTASSQARIGNSATNSIGGYAGWTTFSDGRFKKNVLEDVKGIDFIMRLRPVTYQLDVTGLSTQLNESRGRELHESTRMAMAQKEKIFFSGFIAQEVEEAARLSGYDFSGIDKPQNENDFYGLRYSEFVIPLVKAMQQQQLQLESLKTEIQLLKEQNKLLLQLVNR